MLDAIHHSAKHLHSKQDSLIDSDERHQALAEGIQWKGRPRGLVDLQLHWVPGHYDFKPNKRADEEARLVAQGSSSDARFLPLLLHRKLPLSISTLCQDNNEKLKKRWQRHWKNLEKKNLLRTIDNSTPSKKYLQLISGLDHRQASLLFQLRLGHIAFNQHLFHIYKAESPACPQCQGITVETVKHYLLDCPFYRNEQHLLRRKLCHNAG